MLIDLKVFSGDFQCCGASDLEISFSFAKFKPTIRNNSFFQVKLNKILKIQQVSEIWLGKGDLETPVNDFFDFFLIL